MFLTFHSNILAFHDKRDILQEEKSYFMPHVLFILFLVKYFTPLGTFYQLWRSNVDRCTWFRILGQSTLPILVRLWGAPAVHTFSPPPSKKIQL
jgi:hypothetical protein